MQRLGVQKRVTLKRILLSVFFALYFDYAATFKKATTVKNERTYAKQIVAFIGDKNLDEIGPQELDMWRAEVLRKHAPATFNIRRRFLHAAFNVAVKWGHITGNLISGVAKAKSEERRVYLTLQEFGRVLSLLDADIADPKKQFMRRYNLLFRAFLVFLLLTGLRRQEAINLRKNDLDLENGALFISKTKGKRDRVVPLHPHAKEIILSLDDRLFNNLRPASVSHKFKSLCQRAGLSENFKLHSLRHTTGTMLNEKGVDISSIQSILGHADIRTTLIYSKVTVNKLRKDIGLLDVPGEGDPRTDTK